MTHVAVVELMEVNLCMWSDLPNALFPEERTPIKGQLATLAKVEDTSMSKPPVLATFFQEVLARDNTYAMWSVILHRLTFNEDAVKQEPDNGTTL